MLRRRRRHPHRIASLRPAMVSKRPAKSSRAGKLPASGEDKKRPMTFVRTWPKDDEVRILEFCAAYRREHGKLPQYKELGALIGNLDRDDSDINNIRVKYKNLRRRHLNNVKAGHRPRDGHDRRLLELSKEVWGGVDKPASGGAVLADFEDVCKMYPFLGAELRSMNRKYSGLYRRRRIDITVAGTLEKKIKKEIKKEVEVARKRLVLTMELHKCLSDLASCSRVQ